MRIPAISRSSLSALSARKRIILVIAVAVSAHDEESEPLWGMIVGAPSSGKTEQIRSLDDVTDDRVDELSAPALLSWTKNKVPKPTGVLTP